MGRPRGSKNRAKQGRSLANRRETITIRLKAAEKKRVEVQAEENGVSTSEYIRKKLSGKNISKEKRVNVAETMVKMQNIMNYIKEKGLIDDNEVLEEMVGALWEGIS